MLKLIKHSGIPPSMYSNKDFQGSMQGESPFHMPDPLPMTNAPNITLPDPMPLTIAAESTLPDPIALTNAPSVHVASPMGLACASKGGVNARNVPYPTNLRNFRLLESGEWVESPRGTRWHFPEEKQTSPSKGSSQKGGAS